MAFRGDILATTKFIRWNVPTGEKATSLDVPKGFFAVCVGETLNKKYVVPLSYLKHPSFQDLPRKVEKNLVFSSYGLVDNSLQRRNFF